MPHSFVHKRIQTKYVLRKSHNETRLAFDTPLIWNLNLGLILWLWTRMTLGNQLDHTLSLKTLKPHFDNVPFEHGGLPSQSKGHSPDLFVRKTVQR